MKIYFDSQVEYGNWCRTEGKNIYFITLTGPFDRLPVIVQIKDD